MNYQEIISVVSGDIKRLEELIAEDKFFVELSGNSFLLRPGKRIRSALAFLLLRAFGYEVSQEQYKLQAAVELAHNASLIHDDIIDGSEFRRGQTTINVQNGDKYAVLAGDYTLSVALKNIISLNNNNITKDFLDVFAGMVLGELSQLSNKNQIPAFDDYLMKTARKTAGLFKVALKSAAILAGCTEEVEIWGDFGYNFGLAFQVKNDLKDLNTDISNGVYTAPVIFSNSVNDITPDAIRKTKDLVNNYLVLPDLPKNEYSDALKKLLEYYKEC